MKTLLLLCILLILPSTVFSATLKGNIVHFYPTIWEIRGIGNAVWEEENLLISADGIIVNLLTKNIIAFGNVVLQKDGKKEYYDIFFSKELNLGLYEAQTLPYITAKEIKVDWRSNTITFKSLKVSPDIILPQFSLPFGPYSSGMKFSVGEETILIDTSTPYVSIILPYNGEVFTGIFTDLGMEISYEKEDYYLLGVRAYTDRGMSLFGKYTLYSSDKSLSLTLGYDESSYTTIKKELRNGIWKYTGEGRIDWKDKPKITISLSAEKWDKMNLKGELIVYTETGAIEFNPYIGYRFDIFQDLSLNIYLSKIGLDSLKITYRLQPTVNLKIGYANPDKYTIGIEWGYRGVELIDYNGIMSLIIR
ncbi:MAG: hypothetical protein ACP5K2_04730 [bacterium]